MKMTFYRVSVTITHAPEGAHSAYVDDKAVFYFQYSGDARAEYWKQAGMLALKHQGQATEEYKQMNDIYECTITHGTYSYVIRCDWVLFQQVES